MDNHDLIVVVGPTASGKTAFAVDLADRMRGEIISGDSRQVFKGMDIGTGKDLDEYQKAGREIPYHLIDIREAGAKYNVAEFQRDFLSVWKNLGERKVTPILCGGSGMYVESVLSTDKEMTQIPRNESLRAQLKGMDTDQLASYFRQMESDLPLSDDRNPRRLIRSIEIADYLKDHPNAPQQPFVEEVPNPIIFGLEIDRDTRRNRISDRLKRRLEEGMVEEVQGLLDNGVKADDLIFYGLEYRWVTLHCLGEISFDQMFKKLETSIHRFAKSQMTWFRGMERRGFKIHWLDAMKPAESMLEEAMTILRREG